MRTSEVDVNGFEPPAVGDDGTLWLTVTTTDDERIQMSVDSALVTDLALALINATVNRLERGRFQWEAQGTPWGGTVPAK
jgi:hypothetical protein